MDREEAMKILKGFHDKSALFSVRTALDTIIPELKESEDEKIRKALVRFHKGTIDIDGIKGEDILAWLEKQGQKLTDDEMTQVLRTEYEKGRADAIAEMQKEWSDKEKQMYADIIEATKKSGIFKEAYKRELVDFLNSLKERYAWKPSDEQIVVLELASKYERVFTPKQIDILIGLKEQLKKLKGE